MRSLTQALVLSGILVALCQDAGAAPVPAANDRSGVFEDGIFRLPALADPKDVYILKIAVPGEKEDRTITLPAGAIGLVLDSQAVPAGAWSWTFRVQRKVTEPVPLVTPDNVRISTWDLHYLDNTWLLEWQKLANASKYRVTVAIDKASDSTKAPEWGSDSVIECDAACLEEMVGANAHQRIALKAGQRYRWSVSALDKDGIVIANSEARVLEVAPSRVVALQDAGWHLQRSDTISAQDAAKPALFSYGANDDGTNPRTSAYSAQMALLWHGGGILGGSIFPRLSLETRRTSSGEAKANDQTRVRLGGFGATYHSTWSAAVKYETARKDDTRKGMLELGITPVAWGLDVWHPIGPGPVRDSSGVVVPSSVPILEIKPLISFAADIGKTFSVGTSKETNDTVKRLRSDLRLDMLWGRVARALGVVYVETYAERTHWRLVGQGKTYRFDQAGISVGLTPEISLDVAYSRGHEAPTFEYARSTNVGLGVQF